MCFTENCGVGCVNHFAAGVSITALPKVGTRQQLQQIMTKIQASFLNFLTPALKYRRFNLHAKKFSYIIMLSTVSIIFEIEYYVLQKNKASVSKILVYSFINISDKAKIRAISCNIALDTQPLHKKTMNSFYKD